MFSLFLIIWCCVSLLGIYVLLGYLDFKFNYYYYKVVIKIMNDEKFCVY